MANNAYAPSGALFSVDEEKRKSEKSPHYQGNFELSREVIDDLVQQLQDDPTTDRAKFRMVGWRKQSKKGNTFLSLVGNVFEDNGQWQKKDNAENKKPIDDSIPF